MSKFEQKFGKYAIRNISLYLIVCYAFGYIVQLINPEFLMMLTLDPYKIIMKLQVWRLFTWVLIPPDSISIWVVISLYFYWSIGTNLEHTWGTYRYNVYLLTGFLCTIIGSFLYLLIGTLQYYPIYEQAGIPIVDLMSQVGTVASYSFSTFYVNMSILLLFAFTFPDVQVLLMFIVPIKVKWLGIAYAVLLGYDVVMAAINGAYPIVISIIINYSSVHMLIC